MNRLTLCLKEEKRSVDSLQSVLKCVSPHGSEIPQQCFRAALCLVTTSYSVFPTTGPEFVHLSPLNRKKFPDCLTLIIFSLVLSTFGQEVDTEQVFPSGLGSDRAVRDSL